MMFQGVQEFDAIIIDRDEIQSEAMKLVSSLRPQWNPAEIKITVRTETLAAFNKWRAKLLVYLITSGFHRRSGQQAGWLLAEV